MQRFILTHAISLALIFATQVAPAQEAGEPSSKTTAERQTALFVAGPNMGFVGFDDAEALDGPKVAATTDLTLSTRTVSQPRDAALDRRGALYLISGANRGSIAVYDNPLTANGARRPDRAVFGEGTKLSRSLTGVAVDDQNDLLYVSNARTGLVVFDISSPETFDGDVAPVRTFKVDMSQFKPEQLRFANGSLYIVDPRGGTSDIVVFDNPGTLEGKVTPDRVISNIGFDNKIGVDVDAKDRLLVGVRRLGQVMIFNGASKLDGPARPIVKLSIATTDVDPKPAFATTDSEDRLYVADASGNVVFSFDMTSELVSGKRAPNRTIHSSDLIAPNRLLVFER